MHHNRFDYSPIVKRPPIRWPNGARVALWIVPSVEWFEFDCPGPGLAPPPPAPPDVFNYAWKDYGLRVGIWRLMETLEQFEARATVALDARVCEQCPEIVEEGKKRNWEFMGHGRVGSQILSGLGLEEERRIITESVATIIRYVGEAPRGWMGQGLAETPNTPDLLAEAGIRYTCDWANDEQPYPLKVRGGTLLSIPYSPELDDLSICVQRGHSAEAFGQLIQDQFDVLYEEGARNGRVMAIGLHPFVAGVPHRHKHFVRALEYVARHRGVWWATGSEICDWYYKNYA